MRSDRGIGSESEIGKRERGRRERGEEERGRRERKERGIENEREEIQESEEKMLLNEESQEKII